MSNTVTTDDVDLRTVPADPREPVSKHTGIRIIYNGIMDQLSFQQSLKPGCNISSSVMLVVSISSLYDITIPQPNPNDDNRKLSFFVGSNITSIPDHNLPEERDILRRYCSLYGISITSGTQLVLSINDCKQKSVSISDLFDLLGYGEVSGSITDTSSLSTDLDTVSTSSFEWTTESLDYLSSITGSISSVKLSNPFVDTDLSSKVINSSHFQPKLHSHTTGKHYKRGKTFDDLSISGIASAVDEAVGAKEKQRADFFADIVSPGKVLNVNQPKLLRAYQNTPIASIPMDSSMRSVPKQQYSSYKSSGVSLQTLSACQPTVPANLSFSVADVQDRGGYLADPNRDYRFHFYQEPGRYRKHKRHQDQRQPELIEKGSIGAHGSGSGMTKHGTIW